MANLPKFDRTEVIKQACYLFWEKGYSNTSTRDIQQTVNMRPGSIYAAFNNKKGLYEEALRFYVDEVSTQISACVDNADSVLGGLESFASKILVDDCGELPSAICMLVKTSMEITQKDSQLTELTGELFAQLEAQITDLFTKAQRDGELPNKKEAIEYARSFEIQFTGLRAYLSGSKDKMLAKHLINQMFTTIRTL